MHNTTLETGFTLSDMGRAALHSPQTPRLILITEDAGETLLLRSILRQSLQALACTDENGELLHTIAAALGEALPDEDGQDAYEEPPQTCGLCGEYYEGCTCYETEEPEREAVPFGFEEYDPSPYDGTFSED